MAVPGYPVLPQLRHHRPAAVAVPAAGAGLVESTETWLRAVVVDEQVIEQFLQLPQHEQQSISKAVDAKLLTLRNPTSYIMGCIKRSSGVTGPWSGRAAPVPNHGQRGSAPAMVQHRLLAPNISAVASPVTSGARRWK